MPASRGKVPLGADPHKPFWLRDRASFEGGFSATVGSSDGVDLASSMIAIASSGSAAIFLMSISACLGDTDRGGVAGLGVERRAVTEFARARGLVKVGLSLLFTLTGFHNPVGESVLLAAGKAGLAATGTMTGRDGRRILPSELLILERGSGKDQFESTGAPADAWELADPKRRLRA